MRVFIKYKVDEKEEKIFSSLLTLEDDIQNIIKEHDLYKIVYLNTELETLHASKILESRIYWKKKEIKDTKYYFSTSVWSERFELFYDLMCADKEVIAYGNKKITVTLHK